MDSVDSIALQPRFWTNPLYRRASLAPYWVGVAICVALLALFGVASWLFGGVEIFRSGEDSLWHYREVRLALLVASMAGFLPTARHYVIRAAARNYTSLRPLLSVSDDDFVADRERFCALDPVAARGAGLAGLLLAPLTALIVDRDPGLYFREGYWAAEQAYAWAIGCGAVWFFGSFIYATLAYARRFSELAGRLRPIDPFEVDRCAPFARQGLQSALLVLILLSIITLNVVDTSWFIFMAALAVVAGTTALFLPARGVHAQLVRTKHDELGRVHAAIRGVPGALGGSAIEARGEVGLADLLAYRELVESMREWPVDGSTLARFFLYLALPVGSWLGGALVERMLGAALD